MVKDRLNKTIGKSLWFGNDQTVSCVAHAEAWTWNAEWSVKRGLQPVAGNWAMVQAWPGMPFQISLIPVWSVTKIFLVSDHPENFSGLRREDFQVPGKVTAVSHFWKPTYVDPGQKYKLPRINDAINGSGSIYKMSASEVSQGYSSRFGVFLRAHLKFSYSCTTGIVQSCVHLSTTTAVVRMVVRLYEY